MRLVLSNVADLLPVSLPGSLPLRSAPFAWFLSQAGFDGTQHTHKKAHLPSKVEHCHGAEPACTYTCCGRKITKARRAAPFFRRSNDCSRGSQAEKRERESDCSNKKL